MMSEVWVSVEGDILRRNECGLIKRKCLWFLFFAKSMSTLMPSFSGKKTEVD